MRKRPPGGKAISNQNHRPHQKSRNQPRHQVMDNHSFPEACLCPDPDLGERDHERMLTHCRGCGQWVSDSWMMEIGKEEKLCQYLLKLENGKDVPDEDI